MRSEKELLKIIVEKDREAEILQEELLSRPRAEVMSVTNELFESEIKAAGPNDALSPELLRTLNLLSFLGGADAMESLMKGLNHANPEIRLAAGEALLDLAVEDFEVLRPAVEKVLKAEESWALALEEIPYLLSEIDEPGVLDLLHTFLKIKDPMPVVAAIEVLTEIGNVTSKAEIRRLAKDPREVWIEGNEEAEEKVALGQIACEALEIMGEDEKEA